MTSEIRRTASRLLAIALIGLAGLPGTVFAQAAPGNSVQGTVTSNDGQPVSGAQIVLREPSTGMLRYGAVTSSAGAFILDSVSAGSYVLEASFLGYAPQKRTVTVTGNLVVDLVLSSQAVAYPGVVVTGQRARAQLTPVTMSSLDKAELDRLPEMKDMPAHLSTLPSITHYSENGNGVGYSYLRMRGFGQRRLAVSINGIPQNDPEEFNVFWINFFDIQGVIDDVQVQRGAGSSFYGPAAIGGAINIRSMPYRPNPYARLELGGGAFNTRRASVSVNSGLLANRWVAFGRLSRLESDGYRDWSWTEFWRFFAGVTRYGERSTLTLQAYGGPQKDGLAYVGIPKAANEGEVDNGFGGTVDRKFNPSAVNSEVENFHQPHVELHHNLAVRDGLDFDQTLFWVKGEGFFDFDGSFRSADYLRLPAGFVAVGQEAEPLFVSRPEASVLFRAYLDQWQIGWQPSLTIDHGAGQTKVGAEARLHRSLRWGRTQASSAIPAEFTGDADYRVYSVRGEKSIQSVWGSHLARPSERLAFQADLQVTHRRYRIFDEDFFGTEFSKSYVFFNPRIGFTLNPEQARSAYVSLALASREPRMKTLYDGEEAGAGFLPQFGVNVDGSVDTSSPFVSPERLLDMEAGGTLRSEGAYVNANVFYMAFLDEIVASGKLDQYGVPRTGNAERTRHVGLEVDGGIRLAPGLDLSGNVTLSRNRFVDFIEYVTLEDFSSAPVDRADNTIAGFPSRLANLALTATRSGLTASVFAQFVGKQYVDNSNGTNPDGSSNSDLETDAYRMVNLSLRYDFPIGGKLKGLQAVLDLNNVLDEKVLMFGNPGFGAPQFFPAATRHAYLGIRYMLQ